jgi:hypothetical protein
VSRHVYCLFTDLIIPCSYYHAVNNIISVICMLLTFTSKITFQRTLLVCSHLDSVGTIQAFNVVLQANRAPVLVHKLISRTEDVAMKKEVIK